MTLNPQFIYDKEGRPANVVLTISEWENLVRQGMVTPPEWQIAENNKRLAAYKEHPEKTVEADAFFEQLEQQSLPRA